MSFELPTAMKRPWIWPDSLDALVAAPGIHSVLFENERVRVVYTRIPSGQSTPLHTHRWPSALFFLTWSDFVRFDPQGNVTMDTRHLAERPALNSRLWQEPLAPHSVKNVGRADITTVQIEIKDKP